MDKDSKFTRDEDGYVAVRVVSGTTASPTDDKESMFTRDEDGYVAVRIVNGAGSGGGSDAHNKGWFADESALTTAYPTAEDGDYAILGSTDTVWVWDSDDSEWVDTDQKGQVASVNGETGAVNIKSINNNSLMGSGDLELSTYLTYPSGWTTTGTTKAFCDDIAADTSAVAGKAYLGEVTCSDLPASMVNAEIIVEIMAGSTSANKVIVLTCTSGNTAPYRWQYTYWNGGSNVSGWVTFGDMLPSQSGNSGKFLKTNGTNTSWSDEPLVNYALGNNSIAISTSGTITSTDYSIALGSSTYAGNYTVAFGAFSGNSYSSRATCLGAYCHAVSGSAAIGYGADATESGTFVVGLTVNSTTTSYKLLNNDGTIPKERLANAATAPATMPTLAVADWSNNEQTVTVTGVTASNIVIVSPAPASAADYAAAGIVCTAQGTDSLTFSCTTTPTNAITVNVIIMG